MPAPAGKNERSRPSRRSWWRSSQASASPRSASSSTVSTPAITAPFPYTTLFRSASCRATRASSPASGASTTSRRRSWRHARAREAAVTIFFLKGLLRSEEHTSELQSHHDLGCPLLLEKTNARGPRAEAGGDRHRHPHPPAVLVRRRSLHRPLLLPFPTRRSSDLHRAARRALRRRLRAHLQPLGGGAGGMLELVKRP